MENKNKYFFVLFTMFDSKADLTYFITLPALQIVIFLIPLNFATLQIYIPCFVAKSYPFKNAK